VNDVVDVVLDGGGSTTRTGVAISGRLLTSTTGPSVNPYSVGKALASRELRNALQHAVTMRPEGSTIRAVCLATSAVSDNSTLEDTADAARTSAARTPELSKAEWVVTNDVPPLLLDESGELVVVVCGTGTSFVARGADGRVARASGREYLLSDEGGGFDIGLRGLRAVVRAADGRGPATDLTAAATQLGGSVDALCAMVTGRDDVKPFVASFAPNVLVAASVGDRVARDIVEDAAAELVTGISAVADSASLSRPIRVRMSGSLLVGDHDALRLALAVQVDRDVHLGPVTRSPLELVAAFVHAVCESSLDVTGVRSAFPFSHDPSVSGPLN
jgi:N-acetylglucosamine kinase-like BadF-type ATPase